MTDFALARRNMIDGQLRPNRVTNAQLLAAIGDLPRERFLPEAARSVAYADDDVPLGNGRYLMEPMVLGPADPGACSRAPRTAPWSWRPARATAPRYWHGWCSRSWRSRATAALLAAAEQTAKELGITGIRQTIGKLEQGAPASAPYDVILIEGAVQIVPSAIFDQLAEGGRLTAVITGSPGALGVAQLFMKEGGMASGRPLFDAARRPCRALRRRHGSPFDGDRGTVSSRTTNAVHTSARVLSTDGGNLMRIRPSLRLARTAAVCALAVGLGAASNAWSQSLIQALSTTYNSNPDLLASRALLRQTDEIAGPGRRQLAAEDHALARVQQGRAGLDFHPRPADLLHPERPFHDACRWSSRCFAAARRWPIPRRPRPTSRRSAPSLADTEQNVLLAAVTSYADLVQNIAIADARRNNVLVLIQQLDATRERFRVGELTITDVSQAEARLEGARADLVQAEAQIRIAEAAFQRAIGQKPGRLGEIPLIGGLPISEDEAISLAMDFGPRAVSAQYRISAASYGVNSAIGNLLPQVNLVGVIQQQFDLQVPTDQYYTYGVRVQATVPIYQNGSEWSQVRQAKELVGQRRNELDSARRAQAENVIRAWRQLELLALARDLVRGAGPRQRSRPERRAPGSPGRFAHHPRRVERRAGIAQFPGQPGAGPA